MAAGSTTPVVVPSMTPDVDESIEREVARKLKHKFGINIDLDVPVCKLSVAQQQMVEIAKALVSHGTLRALNLAQNKVRDDGCCALAAMLEEQGIQCARRTVAKYREGMKIAPANLRKAL